MMLYNLTLFPWLLRRCIL